MVEKLQNTSFFIKSYKKIKIIFNNIILKMYICNFCDYDTNDKSNINHHNKTKKHITNKKLYDKINNLEKKDLVIDKDTEKQIKLLNSENEKLKQELVKIKEEKEKEKQIIQLETKVEIYKELSEKGKNINNNNTYIIAFFFFKFYCISIIFNIPFLQPSIYCTIYNNLSG